MRKLPALLVIMDGFALAAPGPENAISLAKTPYLDTLFATCPHTTLGASGLDVGLPLGQMGNSEVGHLNIGAGRVVYQELTRIDKAIAEDTLQKNPVLVNAFEQVAHHADKDATLHIMGLMSDGGVHSSLVHSLALMKMAISLGVKNIMFHAFMDGRDVAPDSGKRFIDKLKIFCAAQSDSHRVNARIATISGRYYAMDRDNRWERVEQAYNAIALGKGKQAGDPVAVIQDSYDEGVYDEFIVPTVLDPRGVKPHDACVFFNFRPDRARELTRAFVDKNFTGFDRPYINDLTFVTLTEYDPTLDVQVAYPKSIPEEVLADVLAEHHLRQLHTAETEKYAHVTFFLNGGKEEPKPGETRVLIPSPKVATYDLQPEMSAPEVTNKLKEAIENDAADVYIVNYANCDMVGHTGVVDAAVKAVETVDWGLSQIVPAILAKGGFALISADHGNADHMFDVSEAGEKLPFTAHTTNRVPFIMVGVDKELVEGEEGRLCDIAPTLLDCVGIEKPDCWTGKSLIKHD